MELPTNITVVGNNTTVVVGGEKETSPADEAGSGFISNCYSPDVAYWLRDKIDKKIQNIQKGKAFILYGPLGTGKSLSVLHFINNATNKFHLSWRVDLSEDEESVRSCLDDLAERLKVKKDKSYSHLFQAIRKRAENEKVIFFLEKMQERPTSVWFKELWQIKDSLYVIGTSNNASLDHDVADAEMIPVDKFEEAVAFLKDSEEIKNENNDEDLRNLCERFSWNVLGLTAAKLYLIKTKISVEDYLEMLHDKRAAFIVRQAEQGKGQQTRTLYIAIRTVLEEIEKDRFPSLGVVSLIAHYDIPEFLLSDMFSSSSGLARRAYLNDLLSSFLRKSLVYVRKENNIRFFSFHKFTQSVVRDLLEEELPGMPKKTELICKMAGILVKYFNKDNRFRKEAFMQRILFNHAEQFLQHVKDTDDRSTIALARLSELVGFAYTQQQPKSVNISNTHFQRAEKLLHQFCGIPDNFQATVCEENNANSLALVSHAKTLFEKLSGKSSELSNETIFELAYSRPFSSTDLSLFPDDVRNDKKIKKKVNTFEPFSKEDLDLLENNGLAYTIDEYRKLFLPELYASIVYSFGRNYFYESNKMAIPKPNSYINRLNLAHYLSREISGRMKRDEAVLHEYLTQANALLYLLVNAEEVTEDDCVKPKAPERHSQDLLSAAWQYQNLIEKEMCYFEMGILKKKDDKYGKLVCQSQILRCYKKLIAPGMTETKEERDEYIRDGVKRCETLMEWLNVRPKNDSAETFGRDLEGAGKYLNIIGEFLLATEHDAYLPLARTAFEFAAKHEERKEGARSGITMRKTTTCASYNAELQRTVSPQVTTDGDPPKETAIQSEPALPISNTSFSETTVEHGEDVPLQNDTAGNVEERTSGAWYERNARHADILLADSMQRTFTQLASKIPGKWKLVARFLGVDDDKIDEIEQDYPTSVVEQGYRMLKQWWYSRGATCQSWSESLGQALCEEAVGRNDLAKKFFNYVPPNEGST